MQNLTLAAAAAFVLFLLCVAFRADDRYSVPACNAACAAERIEARE